MWPTKFGPDRANFSQAGPILDAKNGPAGLNLVNQILSGRTSFGIQIGPAGPILPGPIFP